MELIKIIAGLNTRIRTVIPVFFCLFICSGNSYTQGTRLLRQPSVNGDQVAFAYAGDIWIKALNDSEIKRLTVTPAVENNPHISPDGNWVAFSSNRSGNYSVYVISSRGGEAKRLTWHPDASLVRGWTPDGKSVLYASGRENPPASTDRLWTVAAIGGPSTLLSKQSGTDGSFSPDAQRIVIDKVDRWDVEWRNYRGGQNTPLIILDLKDNSEKLIPNMSSADIQPLWLGEMIYFLSDRDGISNIWSFEPGSQSLNQLTKFEGSDIKWLDGSGERLIYERDGFLHLISVSGEKPEQLTVDISAEFPWAETKWEDVTGSMSSVSISPSGKRVIMQARGDIFTAPAEHGDVRNITNSSDAADHVPLWSPKGNEVAWFSDAGGKGYALFIAPQDGLSVPRTLSIGDSKMAWEPVWSPDGKYIYGRTKG